MRTIEILFSPEYLELVKYDKNWQNAMGYLTTWAIASDIYRKVAIQDYRERGIVATYYKKVEYSIK